MLILASSSPRRAKLLKDAGLDFIVVPSHLDEFVDEKYKPNELVVELAKQKALTVSKDYPNDIIIGADTNCCL